MDTSGYLKKSTDNVTDPDLPGHLFAIAVFLTLFYDSET